MSLGKTSFSAQQEQLDLALYKTLLCRWNSVARINSEGSVLMSYHHYLLPPPSSKQTLVWPPVNYFRSIPFLLLSLTCHELAQVLWVHVCLVLSLSIAQCRWGHPPLHERVQTACVGQPEFNSQRYYKKTEQGSVQCSFLVDHDSLKYFLSWLPRIHLFMICRYLMGHLLPSFPWPRAYSSSLSGMGTRWTSSYFVYSTYFPKII